MDKLAKQLREDAERIDATISAELDDRIWASLQGITPESANEQRQPSKSSSFWWASSLTGLAAAIAVIAIVNMRGPDPVAPQTAQTPLILPKIEWNARSAVLTSPLEQEIEDLQSDLKKAEQAVKEDIDRLF
jgi:hypothetical protein